MSDEPEHGIRLDIPPRYDIKNVRVEAPPPWVSARKHHRDLLVFVAWLPVPLFFASLVLSWKVGGYWASLASSLLWLSLGWTLCFGFVKRR